MGLTMFESILIAANAICTQYHIPCIEETHNEKTCRQANAQRQSDADAQERYAQHAQERNEMRMPKDQLCGTHPGCILSRGHAGKHVVEGELAKFTPSDTTVSLTTVPHDPITRVPGHEVPADPVSDLFLKIQALQREYVAKYPGPYHPNTGRRLGYEVLQTALNSLLE